MCSPLIAGVLAMHRLTVRTAELRSHPLPDGVEGSSCCWTGASPPSTALLPRPPACAPTWSGPWTAPWTSPAGRRDGTPPTPGAGA
ncbi:hypothetical protein LV779_17200 [Streptomyces thinghirensis]|nr:hypothetical protein [Streptomyces thinghirensis]